ncbi:hypothetical protein [Kitasatospora sp. MBT63]|uniref:hypothetical protein n=1 Tax=Kitasatospora sp. MBT63 TaxID=1444768 RepID=UPI0011EA6AE2|nr:hypothetical protein [Kitasatospora sp. MBT63]
MPTLTPPQTATLHARLTDAAVDPRQRRAVSHVAAMTAAGPDAGNSVATEHVLALIRQERNREPLRGAIEVASKALLHNALPSGDVVAVGDRQDDALAVLARRVLRLHLTGEGTTAWILLQQYDVPRHAAILALLTSWLNLQLAGVDPMSL